MYMIEGLDLLDDGPRIDIVLDSAAVARFQSFMIDAKKAIVAQQAIEETA